MDWLFHAFANTPPGRAFTYVGSLVWAVLFILITGKLVIQHAWGYAILSAAMAFMFTRRFVFGTRALVALRRKPEKLSGRFPDLPRR